MTFAILLALGGCATLAAGEVNDVPLASLAGVICITISLVLLGTKLRRFK